MKRVMDNCFYLNTGTKIVCEQRSKPILNGIRILKRDLAKRVEQKVSIENQIILSTDRSLSREDYIIKVLTEETVEINASDDLGFVYALLFISSEFLKIEPFWYWFDQEIYPTDKVAIPFKSYKPTEKSVRYRGWFINDEVLLDFMSEKNQSDELWDLAFEALLRCGGNMVIPGTDVNAKTYRKKAVDAGLWLTHHHAEPLGAEMFTRVYPQLDASYKKHPKLFHKLWKNGIMEQKDDKTIYNLGFRGQGDYPFWHEDPDYDTPEKRGKLISEIIELQYNLVNKYVKDPIFCTNLYGEVMELYKEGHIRLNPNIIKIWADNGYGKMVSRRQGSSNPRVPALPQEQGQHGIYYHVSFYDLQAANHVTMLPNSVDLVNKELLNAFSKGADDYLIVNCSNIRPHVFYLDAIRKIWNGIEVDSQRHGHEFVRDYFDGASDIAACFIDYAQCTVKYGDNADDYAGEQFYNYGVRTLAHQWMKDMNSPAPQFRWASGDVGFHKQIDFLRSKCESGYKTFTHLYEQCDRLTRSLRGEQKQRFDSTIYLQVKIHLYCIKGVLKFCESYQNFIDEQFMLAFYNAGLASEQFLAANMEMRKSEYDHWYGFYENDCLSNCKFTSSVLKDLMSYIRFIGDGPQFFEWQRELMYSEEDKRIMLLTNWRKHMTTDQLFSVMKEKRPF